MNGTLTFQLMLFTESIWETQWPVTLIVSSRHPRIQEFPGHWTINLIPSSGSSAGRRFLNTVRGNNNQAPPSFQFSNFSSSGIGLWELGCHSFSALTSKRKHGNAVPPRSQPVNISWKHTWRSKPRLSHSGYCHEVLSSKTGLISGQSQKEKPATVIQGC